MKPPESLWALFDAKGEFCGTYLTDEAARDDAVGPRFRPRFKTVRYTIHTKRISKWFVKVNET